MASRANICDVPPPVMLHDPVISSSVVDAGMCPTLSCRKKNFLLPKELSSSTRIILPASVAFLLEEESLEWEERSSGWMKVCLVEW